MGTVLAVLPAEAFAAVGHVLLDPQGSGKTPAFLTPSFNTPMTRPQSATVPGLPVGAEAAVATWSTPYALFAEDASGVVTAQIDARPRFGADSSPDFRPGTSALTVIATNGVTGQAGDGGAVPDLGTGRIGAGTPGGGDGTPLRSYLRFDLGAIPQDAIVKSATLGLDQAGCLNGGTGCQANTYTVELHQLTGVLDATTTAADLIGRTETAPLASAAIAPTATGTVTWDVTKEVQDWIDGAQPNQGLSLQLADETPGNGGPAFSAVSSSAPLTLVYTIPAAAPAIPAAPQSVTVKAVPGGSQFTWAPGTGSAAALRWIVRAMDPTTGDEVQSVAVCGACLTATLYGLPSGHVYAVTVRAVGLSGAGPASAAVTIPGGGSLPVLPSPPPPASPPPAPAPASTPSVPTQLLDAHLSSYISTGAPSGSAMANAAGTNPLPAPTGAVATAYNNRTAKVTWTAPSPNTATAYDVQLVNANGGTVAQDSPNVSSGATSYTFSNVTNGNPYYIQVAATYVNQNSNYAVSNTVTPVGPPSAPTVSGNWLAPGVRQVKATWSAPSNNGGGSITQYVMTTYTSAGQQVGTQTCGGSCTSAVQAGLQNGGSYYVTVYAQNTCCPGNPSGAGTVTNSGPAATSNTVTTPTPPPAPSSVTATAGAGSVTGTWAAVTSGQPNWPVTSYTVSAYTTGGQLSGNSPQTVTCPCSSPNVSGTISGLANGTSYYLQVTASNAAGPSPSTQSNTVTTPTPPPAPSSVTATAGVGSVSATWPAVDSGQPSFPVTSYAISAYTAGGQLSGNSPQTITCPCSSPNVSGTISGLTNGLSYYVRVTASNAVGPSPYTQSNTVTLSATAPTVVESLPGGTSYTRGQVITYSATISNPAGAVQVTSFSDTLAAAVDAPASGGAVTFDGVACTATTSPACTWSGRTMSVSSFQIASGGQHVITWQGVAVGGDGGCQNVPDSGSAATAGGTTTFGLSPQVCGTGLGQQAWWQLVTKSVGPQSTAAINAANGNLLLSAVDSTPVPGDGAVSLAIQRHYNSEDTGQVAVGNTFGAGWGFTYDALAPQALVVPSQESPTSALDVTLVEATGTRFALQQQPLSTPVDVTGLAGSTAMIATLLPRRLALDASYNRICVDMGSQLRPGLHTQVWRYVEANTSSSSTPCSPSTWSASAVLGFGAERSDRARAEFAWDGHLLDTVDGFGNEVQYRYSGSLASGASVGNLTSVVETASGRSFTVAYPSGSEMDVTDPAGRLTKYNLDASGRLVTVTNPDTTTVGYAYGGCTGATTNQLCTVTDPRSDATAFTYATTSSLSRVASITERGNILTNVSYASVTNFDSAGQRQQFANIDVSGRAGDVYDGDTSSNWLRHATYSWGACSLGKDDDQLCELHRYTGSSGRADEDTVYTYNSEGRVLSEKQVDSGLSAIYFTTHGYRALYAESTGTVSTYNDTVAGSGSVTSDSASGRGDANTLFEISDNTATLDPRGQSSSFATYETTMLVDDNSAVSPNLPAPASICTPAGSTSPVSNTGAVCETDAPSFDGGVHAHTITRETYTSFGAPATKTTPKSIAENSTPPAYTYVYYGSTDKDLSGHTSALGWLRGATDPTGHFTVYAYDAAGNVARTWDRNTTTPAAGGGGGPATYKSTILGDSPSFYWRLGEGSGTTAADSAGSNTGTYNGAYTLGQAGALTGDAATAVAFNSGNQNSGYVSTATQMPHANATVSVEAWFKTTSTQGGAILGFSASQNDTQPGGGWDHHLWLDNSGILRWGVWDGSAKIAASTAALNDGAWHHAVGTSTSGQVTLWVDSVQVGSASVSTTTQQDYAGYWHVGTSIFSSWPNAPTSNHLNGTIEEVAIYPAVLSSTQISTHFAIGHDGAGATYKSTVLENHPAAYWRLGESSGNPGDASGNNNNGTTSGTLFRPGPSLLTADPETSTGFAHADSGVAAFTPVSPSSVTSTFTVETWINPTALISDMGIIGSRQPQDYGFDLKVNSSGGLHADIGNGTSWLSTSADVPSAGIAANSIDLVDYVVTPSGYTVYLNGAQAGSGSYSSSTPVLWDANHTVQVGNSTSGEEFTGYIQEVAVYPSALPASQIANDYFIGHNGPLPSGGGGGGGGGGGATAATFSTTSPGFAETIHGGQAGGSYASPWRYVLSQTDQLGDKTSYTLDPNGNQLTVRPPRGNAANSATYDMTQTFTKDDDLATSALPLEQAVGYKTSYTYSRPGVETSQTDPLGNVIVLQRDTVNRETARIFTRAAWPADTTTVPSACRQSTSSDAPIPSGRILCQSTTAYDGTGDVIGTSDANAQTTTIWDDARHNEVRRDVAANHDGFAAVTTERVYDADGNLTAVCPPRQFTEGGSNPSAGCPNNLLFASYNAYDVAGRMTSTTTFRSEVNNATASTTYSYDADGNRLTVTDPIGTATTTYTFDLLDRKASMAVPRTSGQPKNVTSWTYDPNGNVLIQSAPSSGPDARVTAYSYDAANRLIDTVEGSTSTVSAAAAGTLDSVGGKNVRTRRSYDADGHLVATLLPDAFTSSVTSPDNRYLQRTDYDANGRMSASYTSRYGSLAPTDIAGDTATQTTECPSTGVNPQTVTGAPTYPAGTGICQDTYQYDHAGNRTAIVYPMKWPNPFYPGLYLNLTYQYVYTDDGLVADFGHNSSFLMQYYYDGVGRVAKTVDYNLDGYTRVYSSNGLLLQQTDTPGIDCNCSHVSSYTYDAGGDQLTSKDPVANATSGAGPTTQDAYASDGLRTSHLDGDSNQTKYGYDLDGRATTVTSPSAVARDATNPQGTPTTTTYTLDGLPLSITQPVAIDGSSLRRTTYTYTANGNRLTEDRAQVNSSGGVLSDGGSQTSAYYDDGRLSSLTGRGGAEAQSFQYNGVGKITRATDGASAITADYYLDGTLRDYNDGQTAEALAYDGEGSVSHRAYTSPIKSYSTDYAYTQWDHYLGTLTQHNPDGPWTTSFSWNPTGQLETMAESSTYYATFGWDGGDGTLANIITVAGAGGSSEHYPASQYFTYDSDRRIATKDTVSEDNSRNQSQIDQTYSYDAASRMTQSQSDASPNTGILVTTAYSWDHDGNMTANGTTALTHNADGSISAATPQGQAPQTYTYNKATGALTATSCATYTVDGFERPTKVVESGGTLCPAATTINYTYDALNRQTTHQDSSIAGNNVFQDSFADFSQTVLVDHQGGSANQDTAFSLTDRNIARSMEVFNSGASTNAGFELLYSDGAGTLFGTVGGDGTRDCSVLYDPFGNPYAAQSASNACSVGTTQDKFLYHGTRRDQTTGSYQFGARTYDPTSSAYLSPDGYLSGSPVQDLALRLNPSTNALYLYGGDNPVNQWDPTGHSGNATNGCEPGDAGCGKGGVSDPANPGGGSGSGGSGPTGGSGDGSTGGGAPAPTPGSGQCQDICTPHCHDQCSTGGGSGGGDTPSPAPGPGLLPNLPVGAAGSIMVYPSGGLSGQDTFCYTADVNMCVTDGGLEGAGEGLKWRGIYVSRFRGLGRPMTVNDYLKLQKLGGRLTNAALLLDFLVSAAAQYGSDASNPNLSALDRAIKASIAGGVHTGVGALGAIALQRAAGFGWNWMRKGGGVDEDAMIGAEGADAEAGMGAMVIGGAEGPPGWAVIGTGVAISVIGGGLADGAFGDRMTSWSLHVLGYGDQISAGGMASYGPMITVQAGPQPSPSPGPDPGGY